MILKLRSKRIVKNKFNKFAKRLKERIKSYFKKLSIENRHYTKMASFAIIGALIPLSVLPTLADQNQSEFKSNVVLSRNSQIVDIPIKNPAIVPGDSQEQVAAKIAAENAKAKARKSVKASVAVIYNDPANIDEIYQSAGARFNVSWMILKSVNYAETGCVGSTTKRNPSGASGPMQFIPSTWRHYGIDGNGDGVVDIYNISDSVYAAANYLAASGGGVNNYKNALWSYNPSSSYYNKVMSIARSIGF